MAFLFIYSFIPSLHVIPFCNFKFTKKNSLTECACRVTAGSSELLGDNKSKPKYNYRLAAGACIDTSAKSHIFRNGHSGYAYFCLRAVVVHNLQFPRSTPLRFNTKFLALLMECSINMGNSTQRSVYKSPSKEGQLRNSTQ